MNGSTAYALRIAAFYGALFAYIGVYIPFFPPYLAERGLSAVEIGIVMALPLAIRILATSFMTWLADHSGNARAILIAYAGGVFATTIAYLASGDFGTVAAVTVMNAAFLNPVMPMTEALALRGVRLFSLDYGRMRLAGSATFIIGNVAGGAVLAAVGSAYAVWLMSAAAALMVAAGFFLPERDARDAPPVPAGFVTSMRAAANPVNLAVLSGLAMVLSSHNFFYVFGTVHWNAQDIGNGVAGLLWAIGVVAEIVLFAWSGAVGERLGTAGLLVLGAGCGLVRWTAMAFDPPLAALWALQVLHGLTFGATHLAAMRFVSARAGGGGANSLQGLYYTLTGLAACAVNFAAGPLYAGLGGHAYGAMAAVALIGGAVALAGLRRAG